MNIDIKQVIRIAQKAGFEIMKIYNSLDFEVEIKKDDSPLSKADKVSHEIINEELNKLYPEIPILSEEGKDVEYEKRKNWQSFWLIDPLDGTKEFIKKNGEFTVNIALITNNVPFAGVIYIPVTNETYFGSINKGSYKLTNLNKKKITVSKKDFKQPLNVVQSLSHSGDEEDIFYSQFKIKEKVSKGSSLKICLIAEGKAELYFRGGPTWEWDTAAGHAILIYAGGYLVNKNRSDLLYNKEELKNYGFIASSQKLI